MTDLLHDISWVVPYRNEFLTPFFEAMSWLGYPTFVMILLPVLYWLWDQRALTRVAVLVILTTVLNAFLKDLWQNPRPDIAFALDPGVGQSYGMPSGHTQIAVVLWYGLAFEIRQRWAWWLATFLVASIAFSRIYLGVHDLEDILAGLALGLASLYVYRYLLRPRLLPLRNQPVWVYLLAIVGLHVVLSMVWPAGGNLLVVLSLLAFLIAWLLGHAVQRNRVQFAPKPQLWVYPLLIVVGVGGLSLCSKAIAAMLGGLDPTLFSYANTFVLGIYMTLLAPAIFSLIGLSQRKN